MLEGVEKRLKDDVMMYWILPNSCGNRSEKAFVAIKRLWFSDMNSYS